ncbi:MAG: hypothetical protein AABY22_08515 [Nanoarchaeota archaeon]
MRTYIVSIPEVHYNTVRVDANSPKEAKDNAETWISETGESMGLEYSHTLPKNKWIVKKFEFA